MPYLNKFITEVCVDSYDMFLQAQKSGAGRAELCAALSEGGLTPPLSLTEKVCRNAKIPVRVMVRPRSGDFLYSSSEFDLMRKDIAHVKSAGAEGVVFGVLNSDGSVDTDRCRELIALAKPMKVTFHRAFDMTVDPFLALEEIITLGVDTLLTSGQRQVAEDGLEMIRELVKRGGQRIEIMAGGGINHGNIELLLEAGVRNFHFTSRKQVPGGMHYRNEALQTMGSTVSTGEYDVFEFDSDKMKSILTALKTVL